MFGQYKILWIAGDEIASDGYDTFAEAKADIPEVAKDSGFPIREFKVIKGEY